MKLLPIITFIFLSLGANCQTENKKIIYNQHFTDLVNLYKVHIDLDSLENYVLTDNIQDFAQDWDLSLVNLQDRSRILIRFKESPTFPHITFSSSITNLMNNSIDHAVAFYSLDPYFVVSELNADWAADCSFVPKGKEAAMGYGRSFYNEERNVQIITIIIAQDIPLLNTPTPINALRF